MLKKTLVFLSFILLALLVIQPVHSVDVWMHIKSGELIIKDMQVLKADDYSYTRQSKEWLNHQWLSQVFYYIFYRLFGVNGLIYLKAILIFSAFFLLFKNICRKGTGLGSIFIFVLIILFSQERFLARPLVFSLFLFSLYVFILHRYKYEWPYEKEKILYLLIPLQILWVNLHGAAIMGVFLVWAYIIGEFIDNHMRKGFKRDLTIRDKKYNKLFYVGILVLISTGFTPYGYNAILFPLKNLKEMYFIAEWLPSIYKDTFLNFGVMPYYRLFLFISMAIFIFRARLISSGHIIMFAVLLYLSLNAKRHLPFYGFAMAPCIIEYTKGIKLKKIFVHAASILLFIYLLLVSGQIVTGSYFMKMPNGPRVGLGKMQHPDEAVDFIIRSGLRGNIFNDYASGCFLIWKLYPDKRVFLDGRNTIYGSKFIKEKYMDCLRRPPLFEKLVREYNIDHVFLYHALSNTENLIPYLYYSAEWELVFFDHMACIFVKNSEENKDLIGEYRIDLRKRKEIARPAKYSWQKIYPHDYINRAVFYEKLGFLDMAIETLQDAIILRPEIGDLYYNLGTLYLKTGSWSDAIGELEKAIRYNRNDVDAYSNLGMAYASSGKYKEAIAEFRKALRLNPLHKEARRNFKRAKKDHENVK